MEGHRHHSAQQVGHHRGDNEQRRHYHFSYGECFVWSLHTHTHTHSRIYPHVWRGLRWEVKHCSIWLWLLWDKVSLFSFCRAFICRRIWRWPSTSLAFSPPGTSSTNRTRSVQSESGGHNKHEIFQTRMVFGGGMFTGRLCLGPLTRLHPSEEDPPGPIASLW